MTFRQIASAIGILLFISCNSASVSRPAIIIPEDTPMDKILHRKSLKISFLHNTTDFYVYQGITRGFHYELAQTFADYLNVDLKLVEINNNIDTAIKHLKNGKYDLLAMSLTQTPERKELLQFSHPLFQTSEVLIQNKKNKLIRHLEELDGKKVIVPTSFSPYMNTLKHIQDSLNIKIEITEKDHVFNEDLLNLVNNGEIEYTIIDRNIAEVASSSMKNIDYSLVVNDHTSISWAVDTKAEQLKDEINNWLKTIQQEDFFHFLYKRYFNPGRSVPGYHSLYQFLRHESTIPYESIIQKESQRINWDWRLLAALIYTESGFDEYAESTAGAYGLMQIIPETAEHYDVYDYFQADSNIYVGVSYLKYLNKYLTPYVPQEEERIKFVLASYNAGLGHILDAIRLSKKYGKNPQIWEKNVDFFIRHKNEEKYFQDSLSHNGYCNGPQTYEYVKRVLSIYDNYKNTKIIQ